MSRLNLTQAILDACFEDFDVGEHIKCSVCELPVFAPDAALVVCIDCADRALTLSLDSPEPKVP